MSMFESTKCVFEETFQKAKDGDSAYFKNLIKILEKKAKKRKLFLKGLQEYRSGCTKMSALHVAAKYLHLDIVKILVDEFNIDINAVDDINRTALHFILFQQDTETMTEKDKHLKQMNQTKIIEYLMDKNVNVNARDIYGFTPLHYAALTNNLVAARFLLEKKEIKVNKICEKKNYFGNLFQKYLCNVATLFI